jgi:predicted transcriptional regulator
MCLRTLRRHLRTAHGLTPEGYRAKYGLPEDYAMTSTVYSQIRSTLAKESGLGMKNERWPQS